jgi:hypothetical protein
MSASALFMGVLGLIVSFLPQEILQALGVESGRPQVIIMQILGALWMGFAMINWMCREILIGGIYGRPVLVGNVMHFVVGGLALIKGAFFSSNEWIIWLVSLTYGIFALCFSLLIFTHPLKKTPE